MALTRFVVLCQGRTGSNYLVRLLRSHREVVCHGELFHPQAIWLAGEVRDPPHEAERLAARDADPVAFLERVYRAAPAASAVGFKLFPTHNDTVLDHVAGRRDVHRILLRRDNALAQYSSNLIADRTGIWMRRPGTRANPVAVRFAEPKFLAFLEQRRLRAARLERAADPGGPGRRAPLMRIEYRELFVQEAAGRLCEFLGIRSVPLRAEGIVRQNDPDILARFENPLDVRDCVIRLGRPDWLAS